MTGLSDWDLFVAGFTLGHLRTEGLEATGVTDATGLLTGEFDLELPWEFDGGTTLTVRLTLHAPARPEPDTGKALETGAGAP